MNDEQLRSRIAASDPTLDGVSIEPTDSPSARTLLEAIMSTELDTDTSDTTRPGAGGTITSLEPRRRRWAIAALGAAAVGVLAIAGAAVGGAFDDDEPDVADNPPAVEEPTVLELSGGETDPSMMMCIALDPTIVSQSPVAFRGVVDSIEGDVVTLTVDRWYQGGDADVVTVSAPLGLEALIGGIAFEVGQTYLVGAVDGVVSYCGLSGPATPELQQMYDAAFPG